MSESTSYPAFELSSHRRSRSDDKHAPVILTASDREISSPVITTWNGPNDHDNPYNWSYQAKISVIAAGLLISLVSSLNGTILSVAHDAINQDFGLSDAGPIPISYWPTTSWGVGGALFPLILFPAMEDLGVRPMLLGSYSVFACMLIPAAVAPNFATLIATRFITGGCVQLLSNAVASIISNVFSEERERSVPVCLYVTVYLASTSIGPVIGAAILQHLHWRWIAWIELIWTIVLIPFLLLYFPETRGSAILRRRAARLRKAGMNACTHEELSRQLMSQVVLNSVSRPLHMLCTEGVVAFAAIWAAFSLGTIYLFTESVEAVFGSTYDFDAIQAGYLQAAVVIGEILGCGLCIIANRWYYDSSSRNDEAPGTPIPEARLYGAIIGAVLGVAGGMLIYGWTAVEKIHWIVPAIGLGMVGFGTTAVIVGNANYLMDAYSKYAASALAAVGLVENMAIAFLPMATTAMYTGLGNHWASSLLAVVSLVLVAAPIAVLRYGRMIRAASPFMREAMLDAARVAVV